MSDLDKLIADINKEEIDSSWKWAGQNRVMCTVLDEQRKIIKNLAKLYPDQPALITLMVNVEEIQSMGNRMEAALSDQKEIGQLRETLSKMKRKARRLSNLIKAQEDHLEIIKDFDVTVGDGLEDEQPWDDEDES